jgi:hypothetical protein
MHASDAAKVLLIKAIEESDSEHSLLLELDLADASRHARERVDWTGSRAAGESHEETFLKLRARRLLADLIERHPRLGLLINGPGLWPLFRWGLPLGALALGALAQHVSDPHRINLVFAPALLVLLLNLLVYAGLAWHALGGGLGWLGGRRPALRAPPSRQLQWLAGWLAPRRARGVPLRLFNAWLRFQTEWQQQRGRALAAQLAQTLHLSAALLALGLIASLYVGGLFLEYRVGWESTFLDARQVQVLLGVLHSPWTVLLGRPAPTLEQVLALRFDAPAGPAAAQGGAWVHLYAGLLMLIVVLPRLALHLLARWQLRRADQDTRLDLNQAYFVQLLGRHGGRAVQVRVLPCSLSLSAALESALARWTEARFGESATLRVLSSPVDPDGPRHTLTGVQDGPGLALVLLFNLASTPEESVHGAWLDAARDIDPSTRVLLDASSYLERVGSQAGGAQRLREREHLWTRFAQARGLRCELISLVAVDNTPFHHALWTPAAALAQPAP